MSIRDHFRLLADYNALMNRRLFAACGQLSDEQLRADRHAFFGSLLGTLNHLLVGDIIWLQRFAMPPSSADALRYCATCGAEQHPVRQPRYTAKRKGAH